MAGKKPDRLGIMGGTFDPVHIGHLVIAEAAREKLGLQEVIFIPTGTPPHKSFRSVTDGRHRLEMVKRAIKDNPYFAVSGIEVSRKGPTYTVDTLKKLREVYGDECNIYLVIGADTVWDLLNWKQYERVFRLCSFAAVARPGYDMLKTIRHIELLERHFLADIQVVEAPLTDLSSTDIREKIARGESVRYLIPEPVREYIMRNGLYHDEHGADD